MCPQTVTQMLQLYCAMSLAMIITFTGVPLHCSSEAEEKKTSPLLFIVLLFSVCLQWRGPVL